MNVRTFAAAAFLLSATSAWSATPVRSLNDLPFQWSGVAGDLVTRLPMTLSISRILKVTRKDTDHAVSATYDVDSVMAFGSRAVKVLTIDLDAESFADDVVSLVLYIDDELNPIISATVVYDEATNMFTMRDLPASGTNEHYFTLKGQRQ